MVLQEIGDFMYNRWRNYRDIPAVNAVVNTGLFYGAAKVGARILGAVTESPGLEDTIDTIMIPLGTGAFAAAQSDKVTPNHHYQDSIKAGIGAATLGAIGYNLVNYQGQNSQISAIGDFLQKAFDSPTIGAAVTGALLFSGVRVAQRIYQRHQAHTAAHPAGTP